MNDINMTKFPKFITKTQEYKVIKHATKLSKRLLPAYSSKFSKKKYRSYQHFVILLYKNWNNLSYRDAIDKIASNLTIINILALSDIPHFTTIHQQCKC